MSSGDNFIYNVASASSNKFVNSYTDKQWQYAIDNQNGNYINQVTFSLNSFFSESEKFSSLSEGFVVAPMVACVTKAGGTAAYIKRNDYAMALKNSHLNLIDSYSVEVDGKTKIQSSVYQNIPCVFKQLTSMSLEENLCNPVGFSKDTADSWRYLNNGPILGTNANRTVANPICTSDTTLGQGVINNVIAMSNDTQTASTAGAIYNTGSKYNAGLLKRCKEMNFGATLSQAPATVYSQNASAIRSDTSIKNELKSYVVVKDDVNSDNNYQANYFCAIIRLRDLSDLFSADNLSLMKGVNINLTLTFNVGVFNVVQNNTAAADNVWKYYLDPLSQPTFTHTNPLMVMPQTWPDFGAAGVNSMLTYGLYLQKPTNLGLGNHASLGIPPHNLPQCRLYLPLVSLKPSLTSLYLQNNQAKLIKYTDTYSTQLLNVSAGAQVNWNISNGLSNCRGMLVIPYISSQTNGLVRNVAGTANVLSNTFSPLISPFTTEPATSSPLLQLADFGVSFGGKEVYSSRLNYSFEQFIEQFNECNKINGGHMSPLFNGLISKNDWESMYRFYYVNLDRFNDDSSVPKDIRLICRNDNLVNIDLFVYVFQTKSFICNMSTGRISDNVTSTASLE